MTTVPDDPPRTSFAAADPRPPGSSPGATAVGRTAPTDTSIGDVVELVKSYAKQETLGPLKGAGRWLAMGAAGAAALGVGGILVLLGLLRLVQTEWDRAARGNLSWLAYVIVIVVGGAAIAIAVSRIRRDTIDSTKK